MHKQKRQRQSRKRQRYVPENISYEEPQLLEEISLQTVPPLSSIPIITPQYVPVRHTPKLGKRRCTEFVTEAVQTEEPEHKVTKMEQIQQSGNDSDGASPNAQYREDYYGIYPKLAHYSDGEDEHYELMQRKY